MNASKRDNKKIQLHCGAVSIALVGITIFLGSLTFASVLCGGRLLSDLEIDHLKPTYCTQTSTGVVVTQDGDDAALTSEDEESTLDSEEVVAPATDENEALPQKQLSYCDVALSEQEIIYMVNSEAIMTRLHLTIVIFVAATSVSFVIDLVYFSLLRK